MTAGGGRAVDVAIIHLLRLVRDEGWNAAAAAAQLLERVPNEAVLRRARSKVSSALAERASAVAERALTTLDLALSVGQPRPAPAFAAYDRANGTMPRARAVADRVAPTNCSSPPPAGS